MTTIKNLISPKEVSSILGVTIQTLAIWRSTKRYNLPYTKIGSKVFYLQADVDEFIKSRRIEIENIQEGN